MLAELGFEFVLKAHQLFEHLALLAGMMQGLQETSSQKLRPLASHRGIVASFLTGDPTIVERIGNHNLLRIRT